MEPRRRIRTEDQAPDFDALPEWIREKFAREIMAIIEEEEEHAVTA